MPTLPCGSRHDTATLGRRGLHAAALDVVAHAEVMANLVGHGGGSTDGQFRMVLSGRKRERRTAEEKVARLKEEGEVS